MINKWEKRGSYEIKKLNCEKTEKINMGKYHIYYYVAGILNFGNIFPAEHIL